ncbi:hypothetical protein POM88_010094 [Heracleum sosnowskyi]|uniref:Uncharacterized protein n=1 Tax=Heracleum sosnowskyi TaxID=360622 RepID=A0AAD8N921_9APIA|nr:hypothetical protein POM88_010094 [Heracleum sosnowskyi]
MQTFLNQAQLHITGLNLKTKQLCLPKTYDIKTNNVTTGTKYLSKRKPFIPSAIYVETEAQAVLKQPVPPTPLLQCSSESLQYEAGQVGAVDDPVSAMEYNRHIFRKEFNFKEDSTDGQYAEQVDKIRGEYDVFVGDTKFRICSIEAEGYVKQTKDLYLISFTDTNDKIICLYEKRGLYCFGVHSCALDSTLILEVKFDFNIPNGKWGKVSRGINYQILGAIGNLSFAFLISNPRSSNMNYSLPNFLITAWDSLMRNPEIVLAPFVLVVSVWRIVCLGDISVENVDSRLNDTVCKTLIEHTSKKIAALFDQEHIILPHGVHPADIVERMVAHDPHNLDFLSQLYNSLSEFRVQSAFFQLK